MDRLFSNKKIVKSKKDVNGYWNCNYSCGASCISCTGGCMGCGSSCSGGCNGVSKF